MAEYSVVGKRIPNIDSIEKVKGTAEFSSDIKLTGLLCGKVLRSPLPHARIKDIDIAAAQRLKGVKAVITAKDTPREKFGLFIQDKMILEDEKVRFVGDEVAAVAAVDEQTAEKALELIRVDYEELPAVFDPVEAMHPEAPQIHEGLLQNNIAGMYSMECGNIEEGFAKADIIIEEKFSTHPQSHCSLETHHCVASCGSSGELKVWTSTQSPHTVRSGLSAVLKVDSAKIQVISRYVGGGFGSKSELDASQAICILLAQKSGQPVKIEHSRKDQFTTTRLRHPTSWDLKFGSKKDGTIVAKQARVIMDSGAYASWGPFVLLYTNVMFSTLYRVENIKYDGYLASTNKNWGGAFRGFGDPQATFAQEVMMDIVAEKLNMDPIELRLKNANIPNEVTANGSRITSCGLKESLVESRKAAKWDEKKSSPKKYRGVGVASMTYAGSPGAGPGFNYSGAMLRMNVDGSLFLSMGAQDIGQGSNTILTQMAAEIMAVDPLEIKITTADTDTTLPDMGSYGSRVTYCAGKAVSEAAADLKHQMFENASDLLDARSEDLEMKDRKIFIKADPEKAVTYEEIALDAYNERKKALVGHGFFDGDKMEATLDYATGHGYGAPCWSFATQIAEVEVDPETGKVDVVNFVAAHDLGRAINPLLAEGQIEGALMQGLGWCLMENLQFENGRVVNPNFHDYKIPTIRDIPEITPILIESVEPNGPFGAKGLGEPGMVPTAAAIVNAIYDAIGVRIKNLPATPEKIVKMMNTTD